MTKRTVFSTFLFGIKYGVLAVLATAIFLPLPIIIGEYIGRIETVRHYSSPLPALWIIGLAAAIALPFALPLMLGICVLSIFMMICGRTTFLKERQRRLASAVLGILSVSAGLITFSQRQLDVLGSWMFVGIMMIWGMILFDWIGNRLQQSFIQDGKDFSSPPKKDEPN